MASPARVQLPFLLPAFYLLLPTKMAAPTPISRAVVAATLYRVAQAEGEAVQELLDQWISEQEELAAFVLGATGELREEVRPLALYLATVVFEIFRSGPAVEIQHVDGARFDLFLRANQQVVQRVVASMNATTGVEPPDLATASEPVVLQYVAEALTEEGSDATSPELTGGEFLHLLMVLKTVVDALHDASVY